MVKEEFNLTKEIRDVKVGVLSDFTHHPDYVIPTKKVREFIKEETELLRLYDLKKISYIEFIRRRIKLIGDELI